MNETHQLRVFLCHSSADKSMVRDLNKLLSVESWIDPWLDEVKIKPGQDWMYEIEKAIDNTDVVIVVLSRNSVSREGFIQKEIKIVLDKSDEKPDGTIYIIPIRVEECEAPKRLAKLQWIDVSLNNTNWYSSLLESLKLKAKDLGISFQNKDDNGKIIKEKHGRLLSDFELLEIEYKKLKRTLDIREIEKEVILSQAREVINTDSLTVISSRRKVLSDLREDVIKAARYDTSLSIVLLELDQYIKIQGSYPLTIKDDVLREVAFRLREVIRYPNTIGRLDGGEFLIILPAGKLPDTIVQAEECFEKLRSRPIKIENFTIHVTASAGIVQLLRGQEDWNELLNRADKALYQAKNNGGNQLAILED
jgi:diguanylate cyclase (GGDEF)-like protein